MDTDIFEGLHDADIIVEKQVDMSAYTAFKTGGKSDLFIRALSERAVGDALEILGKNGIPHEIIGGGANVLISDKGYRGALVQVGIADVQIEGNILNCGAGAKLMAAANRAVQAGLAGLEFATGIPGSVGGGVYMNAGAYDGCISDFLKSVRVLDGREVVTLEASKLNFDYRHSPFMQGKQVILRAEFELAQGDGEASSLKAKDFAARRRATQPLEYPSAGSTFKRPPGHFAGALIEQAGLKGRSIGGAQVSEKHAGFIINKGGATSADIYSLICEVRAKVHETHGVYLEPEVQFIGEFL